MGFSFSLAFSPIVIVVVLVLLLDTIWVGGAFRTAQSPSSRSRFRDVSATVANAANNDVGGEFRNYEDHLKGLTRNLFGVCAHLQNPELYSPYWADHALFEDGKLVASTNIQAGEIVSLLPMDALGVSFSKTAGNSNRKARRKNTLQKAPKDYVVFDQQVDGDYFGQADVLQNDFKTHMQLAIAVGDQPLLCNIFSDINPNHPPIRGWMGHLATPKGDETTRANCVVLQLMSPGPLCALVATESIESGTELVVDKDNNNKDSHLATRMASNYRLEFQELGSYLEMAYQPPVEPRLPDLVQFTTDDEEESSTFHTIHTNYPGLRYLHRDPDVVVVDNFLTDEECDRITIHAASHLVPCVIKHPVTGEVYEDPSRTSTNANLPQSDVPGIVDKIVDLTRAPDATYLESLQVIKYTEGQTFIPHTDGFEGPTTAGGFYDSARLVTIFCYLNTVERGGETRFNQLRGPDGKQLSITPQKGMAVLHFPTTNSFQEDPRTEHEGCPAVDDKWLLVTWMWKHPRTDPVYAESNFPSIMGDTS